MRPLFASLHRLAVGIWVGAIVCFGALVAPAAFRVMPTRHLAGEMVNAVLWPLDVLGLVLGVLALGFAVAAEGGVRSRAAKIRTALLLAMLGCAAVSRFYVSPTLHEIRQSLGRPIDEVPKDDPVRKKFGALHGASTLLMGLELLAGVAVVFMAPRPKE